MSFRASVGSSPLEATSLKSVGHCVRRTANDGLGLWWDEVLAYNATGGALVANACYVLAIDGNNQDKNPSITTAAAVATTFRTMCVATEAAAAAAYTWVAVRGYYSCRCDGTTDIAAGDFLKLAPGTDADAMIKDGTAETNSSVAQAREAFATDANGNIKCFLIGERKVINT